MLQVRICDCGAVGARGSRSGTEVGPVEAVCAFELVGIESSQGTKLIRQFLERVSIVRIWGAAVLRPYNIEPRRNEKQIPSFARNDIVL
jgi:hypothetical protein